MAKKNGSVAITLFLIQICQTIQAYDLKIRAAIDAAVVAGTITSGQGDTAKAFLSTAQTACTIYRQMTGY